MNPSEELIYEQATKDSKLNSVESDLLKANDYKTLLTFYPEKAYNDRLEQIDYYLGKNLGESMRKHLEEVKNKIEEEGQISFVNKELAKVNSELVKLNIEKDDLISIT